MRGLFSGSSGHGVGPAQRRRDLDGDAGRLADGVLEHPVGHHLRLVGADEDPQRLHQRAGSRSRARPRSPPAARTGRRRSWPRWPASSRRPGAGTGRCRPGHRRCRAIAPGGRPARPRRLRAASALKRLAPMTGERPWTGVPERLYQTSRPSRSSSSSTGYSPNQSSRDRSPRVRTQVRVAGHEQPPAAVAQALGAGADHVDVDDVGHVDVDLVDDVVERQPVVGGEVEAVAAVEGGPLAEEEPRPGREGGVGEPLGELDHGGPQPGVRCRSGRGRGDGPARGSVRARRRPAAR